MRAATRERYYEGLYRKAMAAAQEASDQAIPTPMVVREGSSGRSWHVAEGLCGFAWVSIRPATRPFARFLKKRGYGSADYPSGLAVWMGMGGQSITRKEAAAEAFAQVIREAEIPGLKVSARSRLD